MQVVEGNSGVGEPGQARVKGVTPYAHTRGRGGYHLIPICCLAEHRAVLNEIKKHLLMINARLDAIERRQAGGDGPP